MSDIGHLPDNEIINNLAKENLTEPDEFDFIYVENVMLLHKTFK